MINSSYIYIIVIVFVICSLFYLFFNIRSEKEETNSKILLKNLLEGLDMELPEELKTLDNSSSDT